MEIQKLEALAEKYILLDSLLFKIITTPEKETALVAIPENWADKIITLCHASLFAGHQGVIKTYHTINDNFFYSKCDTLFEILHKRVSYLPVGDTIKNSLQESYGQELIPTIYHYVDLA